MDKNIKRSALYGTTRNWRRPADAPRLWPRPETRETVPDYSLELVNLMFRLYDGGEYCMAEVYDLYHRAEIAGVWKSPESGSRTPSGKGL